jgi:hypothetical protein
MMGASPDFRQSGGAQVVVDPAYLLQPSPALLHEAVTFFQKPGLGMKFVHPHHHY